MKNQIDKYLEKACRHGLMQDVFGAVAAMASHHAQGVWHRSFYYGGRTRSDEFGTVVGPETLFDLASLTKPLCTTLGVLHLVDENTLGWQDQLNCLLPGNTREDKKKINLKQLLAHTSGLPAYRPYYQLWSPNWSRKHQQSIVEQILAEPLITSPGTTCHYSDLGFILLGAIIEEHSGFQLEQAFEQWITAPVGLSAELRFLPLDNLLISNKNTIAATEKCSWRGRVLQGEVHDEHCWLMGGVAGHAGLFGTLHGVASLCEILMDIWLNRSRKGFVDQHLLQQALDFDQGFGGRALGFDRPTQGASSSGRYFSGRSVGHLGFSGVSFWLDPEKDMSVVLLTNRIHPSRVNEKIRQFRPWFHDQIVTAWRGGQSG